MSARCARCRNALLSRPLIRGFYTAHCLQSCCWSFYDLVSMRYLLVASEAEMFVVSWLLAEMSLNRLLHQSRYFANTAMRRSSSIISRWFQLKIFHRNTVKMAKIKMIWRMRFDLARVKFIFGWPPINRRPVVQQSFATDPCTLQLPYLQILSAEQWPTGRLQQLHRASVIRRFHVTCFKKCWPIFKSLNAITVLLATWC